MDKDFINKYFTYENGVLRCNIMGDIVSHVGANGYCRTKFLGKKVALHHLVWIMHNGAIPKGMYIDHIDRDITNNKISNLRLVTPSGNSQNAKASTRNTSGYKGVCWKNLNKKWQAYINIRGSYHYLGLFEKLEDAVTARICAEKKFGYLTNTICQS